MADREFVLKIVGDVKDAQKKIGELDQSVNGMKETSSKFAKVVGGAFAIGAAVNFGKAVVGAASDQEQAIGAANSVFKEYAGEIQSFGETTAKNLGISNAEFSQLAATTGALLKNAGVPLDETAQATKDLTTRAADLAAMYGGSVPDAVAAMSSALKGEMDPLEKYGVSLKATSVSAKAVEMGLVDAEGKVTDYGKAQATMALIMEQSADAQGTFARESGTVAGQSAILSAQFKDLQADLGAKLLPIIIKVTAVLTKMLDFVVKNQGWLIPLAAGIAGVVLAVKAWTAATKAWGVATKVGTAIQWAFNAAMSANPITLIVIAIAALVAGFVLLYTKVDWFREAVDAAVRGIVDGFKWVLEAVTGVFDWVKENWPLLLAILTGPFGLAVLAIVKNWDEIKEAIGKAIEGIETVVAAIVDVVTWPFKQAYGIITDTIGAIPGLFTTAIGGIGSALSTVWDVVTWPFRTAVDSIRSILGAIPGAFDWVVSSIGVALSNVWSVVSAPFKYGADLATAAFDGVLTWFKNLGYHLWYALQGVADIVKAPFQAAFDAIKWLWNSTVGGFGFTVPSWIPGVGGKGFHIPEMASGGIVTGPTLALIGEAGPEAVIPLDQLTTQQPTVVNINVYALTANAEVGRKVHEALREYERMTGAA